MVLLDLLNDATLSRSFDCLYKSFCRGSRLRLQPSTRHQRKPDLDMKVSCPERQRHRNGLCSHWLCPRRCGG
jgi:hypothetical protein